MSEVIRLADAAPDVERDQRNMRRGAARLFRRLRLGVEIVGWVVVFALLVPLLP